MFVLGWPPSFKVKSSGEEVDPGVKLFPVKVLVVRFPVMNCDVDLVSGTTSGSLIEDSQAIECLLNNQHLVEMATIDGKVLSCVWAPGVLSALLGDASKVAI
jgi:hypothetical protein